MSRYRHHHTCDLCRGTNSDQCPNNDYQIQTEEIPCPRCGTDGHIYYDGYTGEEVSKDVWGLLPEQYREEEVCDNCGGSGFLTIEHDEEDEF